MKYVHRQQRLVDLSRTGTPSQHPALLNEGTAVVGYLPDPQQELGLGRDFKTLPALHRDPSFLARQRDFQIPVSTASTLADPRPSFRQSLARH